MATNYGDFDFEDFSDEIILKVLSYLDLNSRFNCFFTSKRLRAICQDHTLPSLWQKIHLYDPNFLFETSKNPKNTVVKEFEEIMQQKHQLQSTWERVHLHNMWPCEVSRNLCLKMNNNLKQNDKSYLNINISNFDDESIQEILSKGCNYLVMSDMLPRVGCEIMTRICKEKNFPELKEVKFTWCLLDETGDKSNQHLHPCVSLLKNGYEIQDYFQSFQLKAYFQLDLTQWDPMS